jgi:hypothetical protein
MTFKTFFYDGLNILAVFLDTNMFSIPNITRHPSKPKNPKYWLRIIKLCGPGSSVGIATGYGLDGPGIESRWGRDFPHLSRPALGPAQPPVQWVPGLSRG